uniref:Replisome organizer protein n=1 Tax=Ackermannviridae sp. ctQad106 TaxID=2826820 RepID=A0A8S5QMM9_9CAUD|nr:MAG TPA: replisome organizer protein [Ackermannviridae sp. ctQad106]
MRSRLNLTGNALLVYACVFGFSQAGEWYTGTAAYLADWCGCSKRAIFQQLSTLTERGLLEKRTRDVGGVTFCDYRAVEPGQEPEPEKDNAPASPPMQNFHGGDEKSSPHNIKINNTRVSKDTLVCANSGGFEAFWTAYPKKKSKGQALSAWKKLKPDSSLQVVILKAIEAQKRSPDWQKDKGQYIPYPATWLNAMAWEDEVPAEQKRREVQYLP